MLRLLWDPPTPAGRGPKQKLTLDQVIDAGMAVAAADGVDKLSMRNVAAHLGVGAMSLYTYVPGRDELFELMVDRAWAGRKMPDRSAPWREQVEFHARQAWAMYQTHPWLIRSNLWRMPLGPHVMDAQEDLYRAVTLTGLPNHEVVQVAGLVESHVFGVARSVITDTSVSSNTGITADDYWDSRSSFWGTYYSPERFPTMTAIWESGAFEQSVGDKVEFGLARLLDGVELLIEKLASS
ncbi:TetR/AcrR family transcriptional regulator [Aeromicrobium ginsengisoli]|uniref:TetR/AcrR family transcriptional regulator n=2 Tax=Aeromicrobium ginsengisoli TaxID=363867 RepID=A0A5M4F9M3_9ACTN|nr:TetR/AcrR family transcriptional regulator [Aeromicrobium ginsengisoli]